jgi:predicted alpha-1,2-mannosidase
MKRIAVSVHYLVFSLLIVFSGCRAETDYNAFVNRFTGTGGNAGIIPVASVPFGMVQLGPDTRTCGSGYHYNDENLLGFSHIHKSGGGCSDFLDILFLPLAAGTATEDIMVLPRAKFTASLNHEAERSVPGYYSLDMYESSITAELTATLRCGFQRYNYLKPGKRSVLLDLEHGSDCGCSIVREQDVDTVIFSSFEIVDAKTIRGSRVSGGFSPEQHVYFHTTFSHPVENFRVYADNMLLEGVTSVTGRNIKVLLDFGSETEILDIKTGISATGLEGAMRNHAAEISGREFDELKKSAYKRWNDVLSSVLVETSGRENKEIFYTALFNVMMYPTLSSDVDNRYRGSDRQVHQTDGYSYYGGVMGFWDTFRAACPLQAILQPEVTGDYVKTCLDHYKHAGQLPIWTLANAETYQMIGLPAIPFIANAYLSGVRNFDTDYALEAMQVSAMKDTSGFSMNYFVGLENYKRYGYVPCDLEMESVARTLEYAYADHAVAQFARHTGQEEVYSFYKERSMNYKNVMDPETRFARGRLSDGSWRTPFDPLRSEHRRDDYCEGNAWQWSFFVPHDAGGLADFLGGAANLTGRLDSLFTLQSEITGEEVSGDISGLIGQYAHGNEPGHHTVYMYNSVGEPHKTQYYVNQILTTLYDTTPEGICGNEDTGQMSAWYVFSAMGFYPMDPVSGKYELGAPLFEKVTISLPSGKSFRISAENLSRENFYVKAVYLNGKKLNRTHITVDELLAGGNLHFVMTGSPV